MAQIRLRKQEVDGHLPMVCMWCGRPAVVTVVKKMSCCPPRLGYLLLLLLPGLLIYGILALVFTKQAWV